MTQALWLLVLPLLWVCGAFAPGFALVGRTSAKPLEKVTAAVGASILILYFTSFTIFLLGLPGSAYFAVTVFGAVALASGFGRLRAVSSDPLVRRCLGGLVCVLAWLTLLLLLIRNYSGGGWSGDWLEHYQRALFFLDRLPSDTQLIDFYWLPARPPLMNLVATHFVAHVGRAFPFYQLVTLLLNAAVFLPLCLLAARFSEPKTFRIAPLVAFVALNPMFVENMTYGWTRPLTSFYILAGLYAYETAQENDGFARYVAAWLAMAAAVLTHYSAGPYVVFLALHFGLVVVARRKITLTRAAFIFAIVAGVLSSWFAWALYVYGPEIAFGSNTTASISRGMSLWDHAKRFLLNSWNTIIPHPLRLSGSPWMDQASSWGYAKDWFFLIYQTNLPIAAGSMGGLLLAYEAWRRGVWARFWTPMALVVFVVGTVVSSTVEDYGSAHVCLQPIVLLALGVFAARFPTWPTWLRRTALTGLAVDGALGIGLLAWAQYQIPRNGELASRLWGFATYLNWNAKTQWEVTFLGDLPAPAVSVGLAAGAVLFAWCLLFAMMTTVDRFRQPGAQQ